MARAEGAPGAERAERPETRATPTDARSVGATPRTPGFERRTPVERQPRSQRPRNSRPAPEFAANGQEAGQSGAELTARIQGSGRNPSGGCQDGRDPLERHVPNSAQNDCRYCDMFRRSVQPPRPHRPPHRALERHVCSQFRRQLPGNRQTPLLRHVRAPTGPARATCPPPDLARATCFSGRSRYCDMFGSSRPR